MIFSRRICRDLYQGKDLSALLSFHKPNMTTSAGFINTDSKPPLCVSTITRNETLALNETSAYVVVSCVLVAPCAPCFNCLPYLKLTRCVY